MPKTAKTGSDPGLCRGFDFDALCCTFTLRRREERIGEVQKTDFLIPSSKGVEPMIMPSMTAGALLAVFAISPVQAISVRINEIHQDADGSDVGGKSGSDPD